jgi:hypothetical protein
VFSGATVDTIILLTQKKEITDTFHSSSIKVLVFNKKTSITNISDPERQFLIDSEIWYRQKSFNLQSDSIETDLINKIETTKYKIKDIADIFSGIKAYEVGKGIPPQTTTVRDLKPFTSETQLNRDWKPFYDGKHIGRYQSNWRNNNWIHYGKWLAAARCAENFDGEKILIRKITGKTLLATYIPNTTYCNTLLFLLKIKNKSYSYLALTGILNSSLIGWYFRKKFQISDDDTFPQIMIRDILEFPIPDLNNIQASEISKYVEKLLNLNIEIKEAKLQSKQEQLRSKIEYYEEMINSFVFKCYNLTDKEIKILIGGNYTLSCLN